MNGLTAPHPLRSVQLQEATWLQKFLADVPLVGLNAKVRRELCAQLKSRQDNVTDTWSEPLRGIVRGASRIIAQDMAWPSENFISADPLGLLFWEDTIADRNLTAMEDLERAFGLPRSVWASLKHSDPYGKLISVIAKA